MQKGEQEFVYLEVHIPFWVQVSDRIYVVCGKNIKAEYYFELKILEHMDAAALMRFDFISLESRGICNPATRYIEASRAAFESESKLYPESCNFCCRPCKSRWKLKQQQHTGVIDRFEDLNRRTFGLQ